MGRFQVIEAKAWHCGTVVRHLRSEHRLAITKIKFDGHRNLRILFDQSAFRRSWTLDGKIAGVAGVTGTTLSATGMIWFAMTNEATKYPLSIIREANKFLDAAMVTKRELATTIFGGDEGAKRLAVFLGFHARHDGPGSPAFSRYARRTLYDFVDTNPEIRIPVGDGYVVALGYHRDIEEAA